MKFLPETIASVLAQTYSDFELIVVNDGSSDGIEDWINSLSGKRIRLISQENKGLAGARNTGLAAASGDYIAFIDADDLWLPTKLEKQVNVLDAEPDVGLVYSWVELIDETGTPLGKQRKNSASGDVWVALTMHNIVECGSVALVRQACFEQVGLFDETLPYSCCEDWDMWLRIAARYRFAFVAEPLVQYRYHSNNLSGRWQAMEESFRAVLNKAFEAAAEPLQIHKNKSFGAAKLRAAWKALQNSNGDYRAAVQLERAAITYYPQITKTGEYRRFKVALTFVQLFGLRAYDRSRQLGYQLKDRTFQRFTS